MSVPMGKRVSPDTPTGETSRIPQLETDREGEGCGRRGMVVLLVGLSPANLGLHQRLTIRSTPGGLKYVQGYNNVVYDCIHKVQEETGEGTKIVFRLNLEENSRKGNPFY